MPTSSCVPILTLLGLLVAPAPAQESRPTEPESSARAGDELAYPRDAERVVAEVGGRELTLGDLVQHVDERHAPGFARLLETPAGSGYFGPPHRFAADWVRQFADITALQSEARARGLDLAAAEPSLSAALKRAFEEHLELQEQAGQLSAKLSQEEVNVRLAKFQQESGLQTEVQGWLDFLVPEDFAEADVREFFNAHARFFGGRVTFAHILIAHRDPVTLRLLGGEPRREAYRRMADIRARLKADGSNFEEVAARYSDDRKTAARGGLFRNVARFDPRLPAVLCRTAWRLADGEWTGPVASPYGLHFVKRVSFTQQQFLLFTEQTAPLAREKMRSFLQEELLFGLRERLGVELQY